MKRTIICLLVVGTALCASSPAVRGQTAPAPVVQRVEISVEQLGGRTQFYATAYDAAGAEVTEPPGTIDVTIAQRDQIKFVESKATSETITYDWSCRRLGRFTYVVDVVIDQGPTVSRSGRIRVPGPCGDRPKLVRRATVLAHVTNDLRGDQVVADRQCEPAGRVVGGRARAWLCSVVWFTGPRLCGAGYKVRRVAAYEFGRVLNTSWDDDRLTPILCKRY